MARDNLYSHISGGRYKGRKLRLPSLKTTRSSKSILKESFFNSLQFEIDGVSFVEVFGGSGSIGLEALSRGAVEAYFIEIDKKAYNILSQNCKSIDPNNTYTISGDSFIEFPKLLERFKDSDKRVIFYFDPPFDIREGMSGIYQKVIDLISLIPPKLTQKIAIEHMTSLDMPDKIGSFMRTKFKKFGRSSISYYEVE